MNEILNAKAALVAGLNFDCSCGRMHSIGIQKIILDKSVQDGVLEVAEEFRKGTILLISDKNTYEVSGKNIENHLRFNGFNTEKVVFDCVGTLVPDERAVGTILVECTKDVLLIVSIGSGTINDLGRFISSRIKIPYIIAATAPSMDGYASVVSPLIIKGFKKTFEAVYPFAVIADPEILKDAPIDMIRAGYGDILGKYTALADWRLAKAINNEYFCETSAQLVLNSLDKCIQCSDELISRDRKAMEKLFEALLLSGIAMGLVGNSRPASGSEHHLAHFWEIDALKRGVEHPLHGNSVGAATVVISTIYGLLKERLGDSMPECGVPEPEIIRSLLKRVGAASTPAELGIKKEVFRESVEHAMKVRPRYTVLHLAKKHEVLEELADYLTEKFYF